MKKKIAKRVGQLGPVLEVGPSCPRVRVVPTPSGQSVRYTVKVKYETMQLPVYSSSFLLFRALKSTFNQYSPCEREDVCSSSHAMA